MKALSTGIEYLIKSHQKSIQISMLMYIYLKWVWYLSLTFSDYWPVSTSFDMTFFVLAASDLNTSSWHLKYDKWGSSSSLWSSGQNTNLACKRSPVQISALSCRIFLWINFSNKSWKVMFYLLRLTKLVIKSH